MDLWLRLQPPGTVLTPTRRRPFLGCRRVGVIAVLGIHLALRERVARRKRVGKWWRHDVAYLDLAPPLLRMSSAEGVPALGQEINRRPQRQPHVPESGAEPAGS